MKKTIFTIILMAIIVPTFSQYITSEDNAGNYSTWSNGDNQGMGFTAWETLLDEGGTGGTFLYSSYGGLINSPNGNAFGMWGENGYMNAKRMFSYPLNPNQTFTIELSVNWRDGNRGIDILNSAGGVIFNFNINNDGYGPTTWGWYENSAIRLTITQTAVNSFQVTAFRINDNATWTSESLSGQVNGFKAYVGNTGDGDQKNLYINNFKVETATPSSVPSTADVKINGNVTLNYNESLTVNNLEIPSGQSLTIESTENGTGSLIVNGSINGSGTFTMQRYIAAADWTIGTDGWHLLSSPVASQSISGVWTPTGSGNDYDFYAWSEADNLWLNQKVSGNNITTFETGKGYLVAYQQTSTKSFTGSPNLNDKSFSNLSYNSGQGNGWHLLGNPFSCALKWNEGTLWALNNVANTAKIWNSTQKSYIDIVQNGIIPATQGFFIQVSNATNGITIPKASRVHSTTNWYKSDEGSRVVLVASPADGSSAQETYIRLVPGTTQEFEFEHDARFMAGYAPAFYCMVNEEKLSTQSLSDFNPGLELNYGFEKIETDNYRIVLKENPFDVNIYLHDLKTDIVQNLKQNPIYEFTSSEGDDPLRFKLKFGSVGIDEKPAVKSLAYVVDQNLYFTVTGEKRVEIFDLTGRILMHFVTSENYTTLPLTPGIYFVRVSTPSQTMSSKILIN
ncbi:MAG TPA: hypothetical protein DCP10_05695 [Bacteroidales bacterium]|nr:hypothetical protein [Bacteroidales bacterium]